MSFSAFSLSVMTRVYRYLLQRTLNLTLSLFFLIFTAAKRGTKKCVSVGYTLAKTPKTMHPWEGGGGFLTLGILPPGCQQEIFDFVNLARLQEKEQM